MDRTDIIEPRDETKAGQGDPDKTSFNLADATDIYGNYNKCVNETTIVQNIKQKAK